MDISIVDIGGRKFLNLGTHNSVPIDRIKRFDFRKSPGSLGIDIALVVTDDPDEDLRFFDDDMHAIRKFLAANVAEVFAD